MRLRPEDAADAGFLRALFEVSRPLAAQLGHVPAPLRETILQSQFQAQRQSYAAQFPQAQGFIVLAGDETAGRLLCDGTAAALHIVDIALLPAWRGRGIGSMLLNALARAAAPRGLSLSVADENIAAQRLYARLGFSLVSRQPGYLRLARVHPADG